MKKTLAFTLAETLIVMGIIGVVAALTLPNLNSSTGDKEKIVKLQKIYQNLNDAYGRATAVYGPFTEWGLNSDSESSSKKAAGRLSEFMKISKDCGFQSSNSPCFASSITNYTDGTESTWIPNPGYDYMLSDGTSISIEANRDGMAVDVDIDGPNKGKHQLGSDHFYFYVENDKKENGFEPWSSSNVSACIGSKGENCTAWVIQYGNMDYLKANNSGKCNNSSVTLDGVSNTSCK